VRRVEARSTSGVRRDSRRARQRDSDATRASATPAVFPRFSWTPPLLGWYLMGQEIEELLPDYLGHD